MPEIDYQAKLSEAVKKIQEKGTAYAKAKAISWQLQELRKVVLADETLKQEPDLSLGEKEARGRISEGYRLHLKGTAEAIEQELIARAEYERWQAQFEALRSLCSQETSKIKAVGGTDLDTGE